MLLKSVVVSVNLCFLWVLFIFFEKEVCIGVLDKLGKKILFNVKV